MKPQTKSHLIAIAALTLTLPLTAHAQGTRADYERANTLRQRTAGKVFRAAVRPNWIANSDRFWYRNDLPNGRREFLLVDPTIPSKKPAFDHARLAAALTKTLGHEVTADRLPVDSIAFPPDKPLLLQVKDKTYACDLNTYELHETAEPLGLATPIPPQSAPPSRASAVEVNLTFVNRTAEEVRLLWINTEGQQQPYGTIAPGATYVQHTFATHTWLVTSKDNKPLVAFIAPETPATAVIDGTPPPPRRRNGPRPPLGPLPLISGGIVRFVSHSGVSGAEIVKWTAAVRDNNVFLRDKQTNQETQLTHDGTPQDAYEGAPVWSPDNTRFVVYKTIPGQEHKVYLVESSPRDQEQPKLHTLDYIKPGDKLPYPRPHLFDAATGREIPIRTDLFPNPWSITDLRWEPNSKRFTFLYNQRGHQALRLLAVDAATGDVKPLIDEESKTFIDYSGKFFLRPLDATHEALWMSERDGWNHLYLYDTATGKVKNQITRGNWVVRGVDRVDETKRQIWFRASGIRPNHDPYYIHYARINFDGTGLTLFTEGDGTHTVYPSPNGKYLVDTYSRTDLPPVTELRSAEDGKKLVDLEHGDASELRATGWRYPERFTAKGRDGTTDIYGVIWRPTNFDPKKTYPVLENIYAGPQDSFAPKAFATSSGGQEMAELGFIVVQMDGMGTSNRSKAFHDVCWKNLGDAGFPDRILWIKAAAAKYPYMDLSRVGIYGTSAGGQNALGGLLLHPDFYKAGVADCGCHDNRMDKIWWNEQWMGWPIGPHYAEQSNVTLAHNLQGKLLLMVGEMDNNVDPASTMQVVNALIKANKDFELLVSPGTGHGVAGTPYGHRRLQDFFVRTLLHVEPRS